MKPYNNQYKTQDTRSQKSKKNQGKVHKHGF